MTTGTQNSMKKRNNLYKEIIKTKSKQNKLAKQDPYKKYRNKIMTLSLPSFN